MDSSQDKNLPATERKLQKARDDGQAARSRDLSHLAILGVGALGLLILAPHFVDYLERALRQSLVFNGVTVRSTGPMLERLTPLVALGVGASVSFALLTNLASLLAAVGAGGLVLSLKPITPQFNRLNPLQGFANLFSKQQLANVAKMVLMTAILCYVAARFMSNGIDEMAQLVLQPSNQALRQAGDWIVSGMSLLLLVVFIFAVVDVPLQAFFFKSRLKMSHEEVKREHKESDGNPQLKSRMRQRAREIADGASIAAVPKADFVVMNPTHYAVALRYDEANMGAPQVVSKGTDLLALKIRDIAKEHGIPVLQSPMLARALYAHAELDQPIPGQLYAAVAQVLAYVYRLKAAMRGAGVMPNALPDPQVPPELDPHSPQALRRIPKARAARQG